MPDLSTISSCRNPTVGSRRAHDGAHACNDRPRGNSTPRARKEGIVSTTQSALLMVLRALNMLPSPRQSRSHDKKHVST